MITPVRAAHAFAVRRANRMTRHLAELASRDGHGDVGIGPDKPAPPPSGQRG